MQFYKKIFITTYFTNLLHVILV